MRLLALGLSCALTFSACTWSRTTRLGSIDPWPPTDRVEKPGSLALRIYGSTQFEKIPADLDVRELRIWHEEALRAYGESQLFSSVAATWQRTDLVAEISISKSTGPMKAREIFYLVPIQYRQVEIVMRTRFRRADGSLLSLVDLSEAIRTERFYAAPLRESEESLRVILYDLYRATLSQAAREGILKVVERP
jgi:hypothetical protein